MVYWFERGGFLVLTVMPRPVLGESCTTSIKDFAIFPPHQKKKKIIIQSRYSASEKECLVVVWAIRKFRTYLEGYSFKVITDHMALKWLHNLKNPTGRLARWALKLLEFDYEVIYRKGSLNLVPDALSRSNETTKSTAFALACSIEKPKAATQDETDDWYSAKMRQVRKRLEDRENWRILLLARIIFVVDQVCKKLRNLSKDES